MKFILVLATSVLSLLAHAEDGDKKGLPQIGAYVGNTLPNGITGATEIFPLWGLRYSSPMGGKGSGYFDVSTFAGHSQGVTWQGAAMGISMHIPVETLIAHAGVGLDLTRYSTSQVSTKNSGGGHFIGGVMSKIGGNTYTRFDMKLNSKPGTSLYFAIGLVFELDGSSDGDNK